MKYLIAAVFLVSVAQASILVTPIVTGLNPYAYSYSIQNIGDDPILEISLTASGLITIINSPSGWIDGTLPFGDDTVITWVSTDISFDIVDGAVLAGFGFKSTDPPGTITLSALSESFTNETALTIGPVAISVPEPNSVFLVGSAFIAIFFLYFKRVLRFFP